ncbi:hypothetical protein HYH03_005997 [Edaphochlamys debaryana]|uniref:Uncharacterized protein n=1 Tax=Edaphochlamys debaryana TaxID=47281 RepID=A0A835Y6K4_9CHLO|nr:hypothetical protein HYH03_005997 [Edaphochlamys debaryana]|eukprot:KAG2496079.1 hypothetical protein HYH03_005997 [Edaphochlamys debaryana]
MGAAAILSVSQPQAALADESEVPEELRALQVTAFDVTLGRNELFTITPSTLTMIRGRAYRINLHNASQTTRHFYSAPAFAAVVSGGTRTATIISVQSCTPMVEARGAIKEIALNPGARATWFLIAPNTLDSYTVSCTTHGGGMKQTINVTA